MGKSSLLLLSALALAGGCTGKSLLEKEYSPELIKNAVAKRPVIKPYAIPEVKGAKLFILAENGKTSYVIKKSGDEVSNFAASELAKYLKKSTGADFTQPGGKNTLTLEISGREPADGFTVTVDKSGNVIISGNNGRGLVYGVYDFLERAAGCRFFGPFDYMEVVPETVKLTVPEFTLTETPAMTSRFPHYCNKTAFPGALEHIYAMADYCTKNRYNVELQSFDSRRFGKQGKVRRSTAFYAPRGGVTLLPESWGHNYHRWIPPEKYFATHPEYFAFDNSTKTWRAESSMICTTSPAVHELLAETARKQFAARPELTRFAVMQEDGNRLWCQCAACLAVNPDGRNIDSGTDNNLFLANAVAKKIAPGRVVTYAYASTVKPPKVVKPLDNVEILYCQYGTKNPGLMPWEDSTAKELFQWAKVSGNLDIYSYGYLNPAYTFPNAKAHIASFRCYNLLGIKGTTHEMNEQWTSVMPYQYYLMARLSWNPWIDDTAFRKDYFSKLYGRAGEVMEQIYLMQDRALSAPANQIHTSQWHTMTVVPVKDTAKSYELLAEAEKLADGDKRILKAIEVQRKGVRYLDMMSRAVNAVSDFRTAPSREAYAKAEDLLKALEKELDYLELNRFVKKRGARHLRADLRDAWENYLNELEFKSKYTVVCRLDKGWKFMPDPDGSGDKAKYYAANLDDSKWHNIKVGTAWENDGFPGHNGVGWYRLTLDIPAGKKNPALHFGAADERAWVYLDGKYIGGQHDGPVKVLWKRPFAVKLPPDLAPGRHQLTVKVVDTAGDGGLYKPVSLVVFK